MHFEVGVIIIWNEKSLKQTQKILWINEQKRNGDWFTLGSFHLNSAVIAIFEFSIASGILSLNQFQNFPQVTYTKYTGCAKTNVLDKMGIYCLDVFSINYLFFPRN